LGRSPTKRKGVAGKKKLRQGPSKKRRGLQGAKIVGKGKLHNGGGKVVKKPLWSPPTTRGKQGRMQEKKFEARINLRPASSRVRKNKRNGGGTTGEPKEVGTIQIRENLFPQSPSKTKV